MDTNRKQFIVSLDTPLGIDQPPISGETIKNLLEDHYRWGMMKVDVRVDNIPSENNNEGAGQGVFSKDSYWIKMKDKEKKEVIDKYPDFYKAIRSEAEKINLNMDEMFYECRFGDDEEIEVQYYPCAGDWNLNACWSVSQSKLIEFRYKDNGNNL